ncbi:MAG: hypothetical protein HQ526_10000, partial [Actinobacteria bacterium]|nr:hypothetical protein [Actinomycetota bacterium]
GVAVVTEGVADVRVGSAVVRVGVGLDVVGVEVGDEVDAEGLSVGVGVGVFPLFAAQTAPPTIPNKPTRSRPPMRNHFIDPDDPPPVAYGSAEGGRLFGGCEAGIAAGGLAGAAPEAGIT